MKTKIIKALPVQEKKSKILPVSMLILCLFVFVLSLIATLLTFRICPEGMSCGYQGNRLLFIIVNIISVVGIICFSHKLLKD
ncbi:MAG: hypothetical protein WC755_00605 [Candidatus Woesearchaeota archaeon]|jgi:hypothetical protein